MHINDLIEKRQKLITMRMTLTEYNELRAFCDENNITATDLIISGLKMQGVIKQE